MNKATEKAKKIKCPYTLVCLDHPEKCDECKNNSEVKRHFFR